MSITVGLDFGTHQTKVCIENNDNPINVYYEFLSFDDLNGNISYCLPSIIQINKDHTLSYGFCNEENCLYDHDIVDVKEPEYLKEPELKYPDKPTKPKEFDIKTAFTTGLDLLPWQKVLLSVKQKFNYKKSIEYKKWTDDNNRYKEKIIKWEKKCVEIENFHLKELNRIKNINESLYKEYEKEIESNAQNNKFYFKYFKQAVYDYGELDFKIDHKLLSIWYLSYVIFLIKEKYGEYFSIQMGIPCDIQNHLERRMTGTSLLLSAYYLVEDVYKNNFNDYLSAKYEDLIKTTKIIDFDESLKNEYGILIFPEACACLNRMVSNRKITPNKLHLIFDIGGGTTDISFFSISDDKTNIFKFISMPYGLNFIREKCSINDKEFDKNKINKYYYQKVKEKIEDLILEVINTFVKQTNRPSSLLKEVINNNMSLYVGGGSTYDSLCQKYKYFEDVKRIDESTFPIIVTNNNLTLGEYAILANAYGLAHSELTDDVRLESVNQLFDGIYLQDRKVFKILEEQNEYKYEHGLTDL
ncbi:MAG: hypothetical protein IKY27_04675 [Bacteroidales bacterium]|nr:hypothetical protein [Bacteroidales bacterium]